MTSAQPIVQMQGISIEFPGVKALDDVDFRLFPGEVHALMGENGAGKSTLIKALTGVYRIDAGSIVVGGGRPRRFQKTADAQAAGISTVYQEVNLCTNLSIGENVMLGHEVSGPLGVNWRATHRAARKALEPMGLGHLDTHKQLSTLSIALQQMVAISRAMVSDAKVLILDEPTSSLDAAEVEGLFRVIRTLRDQGVAILFVSHFLDQVYAISDRLTVLRNGRHEGEYLIDELDRAELISKMIGKDLEALTAFEGGERGEGENAGELVLSAKGIGRKGTIAPTDLDLHEGEIVGFAGLLGAGRTELARVLYGADKADSGTLTLGGRRVDIRSTVDALANGIAYSTENRRDEGVVADLTVRENLLLSLQARRGWAKPIPRKEQDELVDRYIRQLNVRPANPNALIGNLSGGNQQKVLLGRWLATQPKLLILDEPTRGIDVGAKAEIQEVVAELAEEGMSVVFISSELEEVVRLSSRIVILKDHEKIAELDNGPDVNAQRVVDVIAQHGVEAAEQQAEIVEEGDGK